MSLIKELELDKSSSSSPQKGGGGDAKKHLLRALLYLGVFSCVTFVICLYHLLYAYNQDSLSTNVETFNMLANTLISKKSAMSRFGHRFLNSGHKIAIENIDKTLNSTIKKREMANMMLSCYKTFFRKLRTYCTDHNSDVCAVVKEYDYAVNRMPYLAIVSCLDEFGLFTVMLGPIMQVLTAHPYWGTGFLAYAKIYGYPSPRGLGWEAIQLMIVTLLYTGILKWYKSSERKKGKTSIKDIVQHTTNNYYNITSITVNGGNKNVVKELKQLVYTLTNGEKNVSNTDSQKIVSIANSRTTKKPGYVANLAKLLTTTTPKETTRRPILPRKAKSKTLTPKLS